MFRSGLIACSIVVFIAATVLAATHRPGAATYTRDQVVRAFAVQGFPLVDAGADDQFVGRLRRNTGILVSKGGEPFYVVVTTSDNVAREGFDSFTRLALPPETFDLLSGNVLVVSDSGLSRKDRKRIRVAVQLLREPTETLSVLAECGEAHAFSGGSGLKTSNVGIAAACLVQTADGNCEWWEAVSFRTDGSVVSWTRGTTPGPESCAELRQTGLSIYDPNGHVKVELTAADVVPSSARAVRLPGGGAAVYVGFTREGTAKFCRLTRALAKRGARLHRSQEFAFAVGIAIYARPLVDYRASPNGICGVPGLEVHGMRLALARQVARQIRAG